MDLSKLKKDQLNLARKVVLKDTLGSVERIERIAAADQAYLDSNTIIGVIFVLDCKSMEVIDKKYTIQKCSLKYIPGFLSYREGPSIIETYIKLKEDFDLLIIEGNGILHPRRIGIASHIGININKPTIGVAKSLLCGEVRGGTVYIDKDAVGKIFKPFEHTKELYVSPGHLISLQKSYEVARSLIRKPYKLPYPLAIANKYAKKLKKRLKAGIPAEPSAEPGSNSGD